MSFVYFLLTYIRDEYLFVHIMALSFFGVLNKHGEDGKNGAKSKHTRTKVWR